MAVCTVCANEMWYRYAKDMFYYTCESSKNAWFVGILVNSLIRWGKQIIGNEDIIFKEKTLIIFFRFSTKFVFYWTIWTHSFNCNISKPFHALKRTWVRIPLMARNTSLGDKVYQKLVAGRWLFTGIPVASTNKTDSHDIAEII